MPTHAPPFLDADAIRAAVPMAELLDAVEAAYRDVAAGRDLSPIRSRVPLAGGDLLVMPGVREGGAGVSVKLVTFMPHNTERGLPTIHAIVVWFDARTGRPLALLDGEAVTAMRTGAASGVATRLLARTDAETLAVIGAGAQAEWQVRAVLAARDIRRVLVHARSVEGRETFAERVARATGIETVAVTTAEAAVREADVVCCATTSSEPVFDAAWVRPGSHVNGIGSFRLGMVELPPELFARAAVVSVDARAAAMAEAGDLVAAIDAGLVAEEDVLEIGSVDRGWAEGRDADAITVFKSVGLAIQDVAAAELVARRLLGAEQPGD
ncbi:MAG: ornithine cyclodeaminase [Chloroflexi bacterium]|nr:ornithine cyclodeaminase [Chloroflexota bacterium]MBA3739630.1 ornithine cyclodeaminase [Chloroflexota bacterium]